MNFLPLFDPPACFTARIDEFMNDEVLSKAEAYSLLRVELTFTLAERLGFADEPVTIFWALLGASPLFEHRLQQLTDAHRTALDNVRQIVPFSAKSSWLNELRRYQELPDGLRSYEFVLDAPGPTLLIHARRSANYQHPIHAAIYEKCMTVRLDYHRQVPPSLAAPDVSYHFKAKVQTISSTGTIFRHNTEARVSFSADLLKQQPFLPTDWLTTPNERGPFRVAVACLRAVAQRIDQREQELATRYGYSRPSTTWVERLDRLTLQIVGETSLKDAEWLTLDGFTHIAGMVASGKSTLAMLLAAYIIEQPTNQRLTLVVGDVQSALRLANQLNYWFRNVPETDTPVAVPLLGRSSRQAHCKGFYSSEEYQRHQARHQAHWGERWISPLCPLQSCLPDNIIAERFNGGVFVPGEEPCRRLYKMVKPKPKKGKPNNELDEVPERKASACPLLATCPQYQLYRDMPTAAVWITTPGAMGISPLPIHWDNRRLRLGELIHEQSDVVVFDEADTIIKWFDDQYAQEVKLTGGGKGLLDIITVPTEEYAVRQRTMARASRTQRWSGAERSGQQLVTSVLTLLDSINDKANDTILSKWIARRQFTPQTLFYRLSRRIAGLREVDGPSISQTIRQEYEQRTSAVMSVFNELLEAEELTRVSGSQAATALSIILLRIDATGNNALNPIIRQDCQQWILDYFPQTQTRLNELREQARSQPQATQLKTFTEEDVDTIESLSYRLQFALTVTLLDDRARIIFYEWDSRPDYADLQGTSPSYRSNRSMQTILPVPLTGRQFGTYYARGQGEQSLSLFAYTNIGRCYVLNFHNLLTSLTGQRGSNVLALSGTSYLPDSTAFHVGRPHYVLLPHQEDSEAIAESHFAFLPQYDTNGKPIRISGASQSQVLSRLGQMVEQLAGANGRGHLGKTLDSLKQAGKAADEQERNRWADRDRLLLFVNSYEQAKWVADRLRGQWPGQQNAIKYLVADNDEKTLENQVSLTNADTFFTVRRADIEQFARTGGRVLVAPLSAIGRGFNILNANGKAAFGAVYFLTRPYPHPHDTQAIAQEVNRRTLDWQRKPDFAAWQTDGLAGRAEAARRLATRYWQLIESRQYYSTLFDNEELLCYPRKDLAATTLGYIIQAVGRLLRGGVPFRAYFVDAAWGPVNAQSPGSPDTPKTSLLAAMIQLLAEYVAGDDMNAEKMICQPLYGPLATALVDKIENFQWAPDQPTTNHD